MSFSVNTNASAFVALQNLNGTNAQLNQVQNRINTGLAVASAKDDAATFAIAQNLRSDIGGLNAVKSSLSRAQSSVDVGLSAAESISDLLIDLKEKAVAASDAGLDSASRSAISDDFNALFSQIGTIVQSAEFNGTNIIDGTDSLSAILNDQGTQTFSLAAQNVSTSGGAASLTASTITSAAGAASLVVEIESAIGAVNQTLSQLGSAARTLEAQQTFVTKLSDTIQAGIGNLVDADLAQESARLQSLQVQQQLGLQALSIANQAPSAVLSLFR
ncbi:MAG: flagellin [Sphingomonadales bacterium]